MDIKEIAETLPHRYPFLFVDRITEMELGKYAVGYKNVTFNEPQFTGHFPGNPIFPGVLILEAMAQVAGVLAAKTRNEVVGAKKAGAIVGIDSVRFKRPVVPGDQLVMRADLVTVKRNLWKFKTTATVDGVLAAEAEILCTEIEP